MMERVISINVISVISVHLLVFAKGVSKKQEYGAQLLLLLLKYDT